MTVVAIKNSPRPSKAHRVDTIVESARKVFCSYGFENGSIGNIAKDAGIAEGTIYSYFDSKRTLLDEVLRRHYFALFHDIEQTLPSIQGPTNRLRYLIRRTLFTILDDRGMSRLRSLYARQADSERPSLAQDQNRRMASMMAIEIRAGIKDVIDEFSSQPGAQGAPTNKDKTCRKTPSMILLSYNLYRNKNIKSCSFWFELDGLAALIK